MTYEIIKNINDRTHIAIADDKQYILKEIPFSDSSMYKKLKNIKSDNVVKFYETTAIDDKFYVVEEFIDGTTLRDLVSINGCFSEEQTIFVITRVCEGLKAIHKLGIVHRDINPNNIMISKDGVVKIIDFGISRTVKANKSQDNWLYNVNVYLKDIEDLKKFKVGDTVTIEGVCDDTTLFGDVTVRQCVIAEKFAVIPDYNNSVKVEIDDFIKAYKENQVSADSQYKGKIVELMGKVTNVTDNYIVIQSYNADVWDWDCDIEVCFEDADELKKASEGKEITIIGECNGKGAVYTAKICRAIAK